VAVGVHPWASLFVHILLFLQRELQNRGSLHTGSPRTDPSRAEPRSLTDPSRAERILARVRKVPPGFVRTYGDVSPGAPRMAGAVLAECDDPSVPWHRIVRADGSLAKGDRQRVKLEREGVPFRGRRVQMRVARLPELI
jgi:alkylated DNA nucleotide flippase Atl1